MRRQWEGCKSPPPLPGRTRTRLRGLTTRTSNKRQPLCSTAQHEQPSAMTPTTISTTAQLLSFTEAVGGGQNFGASCARARCSRRLAASRSRHHRAATEQPKGAAHTYMRKMQQFKYAALPPAFSSFASPFASRTPSSSSLFCHQCFRLECESATRRHGRQRDMNSSKPLAATPACIQLHHPPPPPPPPPFRRHPVRQRCGRLCRRCRQIFVCLKGMSFVVEGGSLGGGKGRMTKTELQKTGAVRM
jgi:hypothetical protein